MKKMFTAIVVIMMVALAFASVAGAAENYAANDAGLYEINYNLGATVEDGTQYGMVVVEATGDEAFALDQDTIRYIDQVGAVDGAISFEAFAPMDKAASSTYKVYIGGGDLEEATFIGTLATAAPAPTVSSVVLDKTEATIKVDETVTLTATVNDGLTPALSWTSGDNTIATVAGGVVTGKKAGTTTITVTAAEGVTATATITVEEKATTTILYGDVNGDGEVKSNDVAILSRHFAEWPAYATLANPEAGDVNVDGEIKSNDVAILSRHFAEWPAYATLPYGK